MLFKIHLKSFSHIEIDIKVVRHMLVEVIMESKIRQFCSRNYLSHITVFNQYYFKTSLF